MATSDIGKGSYLNVRNKDTGEIEKKTLIPPAPSDGDLGGISEEELAQITTNKEKISSLNAELIDGRTDVDGNVHDNIGDAMRGQTRKLRENLVVRQKEQPTDPNNNVWISDEDDEVEVPDMGEFNFLKEDLGYEEKNIPFLNSGYIDNNGQEATGDGTWMHTVFIDVNKLIYVKVLAVSIVNAISYYESNDFSTYISGVPGIDGLSSAYEVNIDIPQNAKYAVISTKNASIYGAVVKTAEFTIIPTIKKDVNLLKQHALNIVDVPLVTYNYISEGVEKVAQDTRWGSTDYIKAADIFEIKVKAWDNKVSAINYYDINKAYILSISNSILTEYTPLNPPNNAVFVRISCERNQGEVIKIYSSFVNDNTLSRSTTFSSIKIHEEIEKTSKLFGGSVVKKPFEFIGKSAIFIGDSITRGVNGDITSSMVITENNYVKYFKDFSKLSTAINSGYPGGTLADNSVNSPGSPYVVGEILKKDLSAYDYVFIALGTNDLAGNIELGEWDSTDTTTFYGAFNILVNYLKTAIENEKVIFISPINKEVTENTIGNTIDDYRNALKFKSLENHYNFVDGSLLGLYAKDGIYKSKTLPDGVHPNENGYYIYAMGLCNELQ